MYQVLFIYFFNYILNYVNCNLCHLQNVCDLLLKKEWKENWICYSREKMYFKRMCIGYKKCVFSIFPVTSPNITSHISLEVSPAGLNGSQARLSVKHVLTVSFCLFSQAHIKFPVDYPYSPPTFRFLTKMWHPNIYEVKHFVLAILYVCTCYMVYFALFPERRCVHLHLAPSCGRPSERGAALWKMEPHPECQVISAWFTKWDPGIPSGPGVGRFLYLSHTQSIQYNVQWNALQALQRFRENKRRRK